MSTFVSPSTAFNFTTATLDSRISFARSGATATRVNSAGLIEVVAADTPRFYYDPVSLACRGLLIEQARTNIITVSADFTSWQYLNGPDAGTFQGTGSPAVVTGNYGVAPDGTSTADRIQLNLNGGTTSTDRSGVRFVTTPNATSHAYTAYLKSLDATPTATLATRLQSAIGTLVSATDEGEGWLRCLWVANLGATVRLQLHGNFGLNTADFLAWGAQLEVGAFPTSYIPTAGSTATRNADVATITGTNFSDFWQTGSGGATVQALPSTVSGIRPLIQFDDGTANEIIALRGNTTNPELQIIDSGAPQVQLDAGTIVANTPYSLTGWWQTNDCKARQNSGATVSDYTATIPTVTQARIGSDGTNYLNGTIATIDYYDSFFGRPIYTRRKNKVFPSLL